MRILLALSLALVGCSPSADTESKEPLLPTTYETYKPSEATMAALTASPDRLAFRRRSVSNCRDEAREAMEKEPGLAKKMESRMANVCECSIDSMIDGLSDAELNAGKANAADKTCMARYGQLPT